MPLALVVLAEALSQESTLPMAGWPDWLVVLVALAAAIVGIWILVKLLKLALWLACVAMIVVGVLLVAGMVLK
jgi:hypothetical protein